MHFDAAWKTNNFLMKQIEKTIGMHHKYAATINPLLHLQGVGVLEYDIKE